METKFIYLNTINIEVAHKCSDNQGPNVLYYMVAIFGDYIFICFMDF